MYSSKDIYNKIKSNNGFINESTKFLKAYRDRNNNWVVLLKNILSKEKYSVFCKNLVLALGAGYTPSALYDLGLRHKIREI